jgi:hypothetical protein
MQSAPTGLNTNVQSHNPSMQITCYYSKSESEHIPRTDLLNEKNKVPCEIITKNQELCQRDVTIWFNHQKRVKRIMVPCVQKEEKKCGCAIL